MRLKLQHDGIAAAVRHWRWCHLPRQTVRKAADQSAQETRQSDRFEALVCCAGSFDFCAHNGAFPRVDESGGYFPNIRFAIQFIGCLGLLQAIR